PLPRKKTRELLQNKLLSCRFGGFHGNPFVRDVTRFANPAHHGLNQSVHTLFLVSIHDSKTEFRLAFWPFRDANGQLSAEIIFDKRGFVSALLHIPGVNAQGREVARLAFWSAGGRDEEVRLFAGRIRTMIKFTPGQRALRW